MKRYLLAAALTLGAAEAPLADAVRLGDTARVKALLAAL